jgi:hypothetical protein
VSIRRPFQWLENRVIHQAEPADRVFQLQQIIGDFEMTWLDE